MLAHLAAHDGYVCSAAAVATVTGLALPTVSKLLKLLARSGLVISTRGASGGYKLSHNPDDISATDVIGAVEGPVAIAGGSSSDSHCEHEGVCIVGGAWRRINIAMRRALDDISLTNLLRNNRPVPRFRFAGMPITVENESNSRKD